VRTASGPGLGTTTIFAKQRAAQATEPSIKSAYEKVAEHWKLLARLESLISREKNNEDT